MAAKKSSASAPKIDVEALKRILRSPEPIPLSGPDGAFEKKPAKAAATAMADFLTIEKLPVPGGKSTKAVEYVSLTPPGVAYLCKNTALEGTSACATRYLAPLLSARIEQLEAQVSEQKSKAADSLRAANEAIAEQSRLVTVASNALRTFLDNAQKDLIATKQTLQESRSQLDAQIANSEASIATLRKQLDQIPSVESPAAVEKPAFSPDTPPSSLSDLKETAQRWTVAKDSTERDSIARILMAAGAKQVGVAGERTAFSSRHHRSSSFVSSGDPITIDVPGWEIPEADGYVLMQAVVSPLS